jgi:Holliday junction resolvasome RuvABC endonuclease subunit
MVILGLDPGFSSLGWSLLDVGDDWFRCIGAGVIRTKPDPKLNKCDDNVRRCAEIMKVLVELHRVHDFVVISAEAQSWTTYQKADRQVAMAWGVISALGELWGIPILQFRPQEIKKALCGSASASKDLVEEVLCRECQDARLHLSKVRKTSRNHAADALGAAWTSLEHDVLKLLFTVMDRTYERVKIEMGRK